MSLNFSLHSFPNSSLVFEVALQEDRSEKSLDMFYGSSRNRVGDFISS